MTVREWLQQKIVEALNNADRHEVAAEIAKAHHSAYMDMWNHLPKEQMEIQIAAESAAKEQ
jgi:hypothetical protein